jgi:hypothetical protein
MTETSWRNWEVKNGAYATDNSGAVTHWLLVANTRQSGEWQVLGSHCTEDDTYCFDFNSGDPWDKWAAFLQDEAVRLADEKGLMPDDTCLLICCQEGFHGSQIQGRVK